MTVIETEQVQPCCCELCVTDIKLLPPRPLLKDSEGNEEGANVKPAPKVDEPQAVT